MTQYKDYGFPDELPAHTHQYLFDPIEKLIHNNHAILDLGCGNGAFANALISKGLDAYGTDASPQGIKQGNQINKNRFYLQDLSSDDLPRELQEINFKTIISTEVIEHLYDPRAFISFSKRILVKNGGGEIIISTPYHGYLKNLIIAITGKWDSHADPLWDGVHIKLWSKRTLSRLLEEQGFTVTDFIGCGRFPYLWKSMVIKATI